MNQKPSSHIIAYTLYSYDVIAAYHKTFYANNTAESEISAIPGKHLLLRTIELQLSEAWAV